MPYYTDEISVALMIGSLLITLLAQIYIKVNYKKYLKVSINKKMTGYDTARAILDKNGLSKVLILETSGSLTDHYDPSKKVVKLSSDIYHGDSIASVSVASHECGHAIQDKDGYTFLRFRNKIVPLVNLSSKLGYVVIMIGLIFSLMDLLWVGIGLEVIILLFQLITLPVEFNASKRALDNLSKLAIVNSNEINGSKIMLRSAAFTYVASVLTNIMQILRLVFMAIGSDDR